MKKLLVSGIALSTFIHLLIASPANGQANQRNIADKPNIVFILADDLGWTDTSVYGATLWKTPQIDRLAKSGCRFSDAYMMPLCSPSRVSFLSGKHAARLRTTDWIPGQKYPQDSQLKEPQWNRQGIAVSEITVAEALSVGGYKTGFIGKWHAGATLPSEQGFQEVYRYTERNRSKRFEGNPQRFMADLKGDDALAFIEENQESPFFLYLSFHAVHVPINASKEKIAKYADAPNPRYAGMVEHVDDNVGRVLDKLKELELDQHTIVLFTSDNGGVLTHPSDKIVTSNKPLRSGKATVYEGGIRVPLIIHWPGVTSENSTNAQPVTVCDYYPTFLEMAGLKQKPEQHQDGISIVPAITEGTLPRKALYWHYPHYSHHPDSKPAGAIRKGCFKLIQWYEDDRIELYDLSKDLGESDNLAETMPDKAQELLADLNKWRSDVGAQMPTSK